MLICNISLITIFQFILSDVLDGVGVEEMEKAINSNLNNSEEDGKIEKSAKAFNIFNNKDDNPLSSSSNTSVSSTANPLSISKENYNDPTNESLENSPKIIVKGDFDTKKLGKKIADILNSINKDKKKSGTDEKSKEKETAIQVIIKDVDGTDKELIYKTIKNNGDEVEVVDAIMEKLKLQRGQKEIKGNDNIKTTEKKENFNTIESKLLNEDNLSEEKKNDSKFLFFNKNKKDDTDTEYAYMNTKNGVQKVKLKIKKITYFDSFLDFKTDGVVNTIASTKIVSKTYTESKSIISTLSKIISTTSTFLKTVPSTIKLTSTVPTTFTLTSTLSKTTPSTVNKTSTVPRTLTITSTITKTIQPKLSKDINRINTRIKENIKETQIISPLPASLSKSISSKKSTSILDVRRETISLKITLPKSTSTKKTAKKERCISSTISVSSKAVKSENPITTKIAPKAIKIDKKPDDTILNVFKNLKDADDKENKNNANAKSKNKHIKVNGTLHTDKKSELGDKNFKFWGYIENMMDGGR
ncbi:hypothetical protein SLOPH_557 [Spraguea lophii 42_110]|uniref:Uncharacterized protein n=1 Tax=Spraguea lophii (strain 42_110) TaxID=1358809 RepID=S7W5D5_SPRLO|nr:hypothetical protein SLOPH_557 [Spraguea lophii 42_110]